MNQIITSNKTILAAALLTLGLTGCASTQTLNYQAQTDVAHVAHAENIAVNVVTTDKRADKSLGVTKNNLGMETGGVFTSEPVETTINSAIKKELQNRGFVIDRKGDLTISADVITFHNDLSGLFNAHANAKVDILISVKSNGKLIYSKNVQSTNVENTYTYQFVSHAVRKSLEDALAKAMTDLFNDKNFIAALTTAAPTQAAAN
jgi:uncharacterized lipoprotein YajG